MLDVRLNDRGPRVVLLQVLLNRRGARLRVDGRYGPHTRTAVSAARDELRLGAGANAIPELWMALFDEARLRAVDAFDMGEERFDAGATIVRSAHSNVVATGAMCNGVGEVMSGIVSQANLPGSMGLLRTWSHGNRGHWLSFTVGEVVHLRMANPVLGAAVAAERRSYVDPSNFDMLSSTLARVRPSFAPIGIYEHHGCSLGSVAATRHMMSRLATLWGVPVTVAVGTQFIPYDADTALRYQGNTFTAYPGNSEHAWISQVVLEEQRVCRN